jgi:hypothetical protein
MTDNTDDESLEDATNTQPEKPPDEIIPTKDTGTVNPNQETENMEVHKHPHHVTHKKKWGEYLLEFLMLFLAVFLGFLAENFREHQVEKQRGKQYIESFYNDLETDTATFSKLITYNNEKIMGLNGMFECYDSIRKDWKTTSCLVSILKHSGGNRGINFSNGTMQQLKNAGGFRLLNKDDRDSIIRYDKATQAYLNFQSTALQQSQDDVRSTASMLKDFTANKFLFKGSAGADSSTIEVPMLFSNDKSLLNKYFNDIFRYRTMTQGQQKSVDALKEQATQLIEYFKTKYHFE